MLKLWNYLEEKKVEEDGEVASWLILAAALAAAAGVAAGVLTRVIQTLANKVASDAGVGGG